MDDFSGLGDSEEDDEDEDDLEGTDESFDLTGLSDKLNSLEIHRISNLPPRYYHRALSFLATPATHCSTLALLWLLTSLDLFPGRSWSCKRRARS